MVLNHGMTVRFNGFFWIEKNQFQTKKIQKTVLLGKHRLATDMFKESAIYLTYDKKRRSWYTVSYHKLYRLCFTRIMGGLLKSNDLYLYK